MNRALDWYFLTLPSTPVGALAYLAIGTVVLMAALVIVVIPTLRFILAAL